MKKLFVAFSALVFIAVLLCSCGSGGDAADVPIAGADSLSDKTVITCPYNTEDPSITLPEKEVNEYLDSLGCDFAISFVPINYTGNELKRLIDDGTPPDIVYTAALEFDDQDTTLYTKHYYDDLYLCLDDYLFNTEAGKKLYEAFPEKHWNEFRINGSIYGMDGSFSTITSNYGYAYDKALVEEYGYDITLSPLKQLDKLKEIADTENIIPFWLNDNYFLVIGYTDSRQLARSVVFDEDSCRAISVLEDKEFLDSIELAYTLAQNGLADDNYRTTNFFAIPMTKFTKTQNGVPVEYMHKTMLFHMKNSPKMKTPQNAIGIYKNTAHPDEAFEFLSLCMTDAYLNNLLTYGVEGDSCKLDSDGYVIKRWDSQIITLHQFINRYIAHPNAVEGIAISREQYIETMEAAAERPAAAGFAVNVDSVYSQCSAIYKLLREMSSEIVAPNKDVSFNDFLEKYKEKLDEAGIAKVLDESNRQYKEWRDNR